MGRREGPAEDFDHRRGRSEAESAGRGLDSGVWTRSKTYLAKTYLDYLATDGAREIHAEYGFVAASFGELKPTPMPQ